MLALALLLSCTPKGVAPSVGEAAPAEAATAAGGAAPAAAASAPDLATAGVSHPALAALLADHWEWQMRTFPTWASSLGDRRYDDQLEGTTPADTAARQAARDALLARAHAIGGDLSEADALTRSLLVLELEGDARSDVCRFSEWSVSPRNNPLVEVGWWPMIRPIAPGEEAGLLARYAAFPAYVDGTLASLRLGLASGRVGTKGSLERVAAQIRDELARGVPGAKALDHGAGWTEDQKAELAARIDAAVAASVAPALARFADFVEQELIPAARPDERGGLASLPDGPACYAALVRSHTTLDTTPAELHQVGLDELARIHAEAADLGERLFGTRDRAAIFERLRTDRALYFGTAEEVEQKAASALAAANGAVPGAFGHLPRTGCEVRRVPEHEAPYTTIAYYRQPSDDGSRPGEYFINVHAPETRPRYEAEALAFHESVPGHHLQIAIAQELPEMPAFRRHLGMTAFVEGWALYSERLADELGLYSSDLDRLGMLSFDAWRASRLVVDTGIHDLGWSRAQAEAFMLENTPLAANNIENEVDRYINTPGQALAYKTGQREILRLRREAEARLGDRFDRNAFHDVVLGAGAVPLPVLAERVEAWIAAQG